VPGQEYPSGFVAPEEKSAEQIALFSKITKRLSEGPAAVKSFLRKLPLKEQIRWLHEFSYVDHMVAMTALNNRDPLMKTVLAHSSDYSTMVMNFAVKQITQRPNRALYPFFSELRVIIVNLVSFSGLEAQLMLETKFVEMSGEIPELRQHREIIMNGLLHNLARKKEHMTRAELRQLKKYLAEKLEMDDMKSSYTRLLWVSKYVMDSLDKLDSQSSEVFKEFVRVIIDALPLTFDPQAEELDGNIIESMEEVLRCLLQAAQEIPDLLDSARLAKVEFYRDGFEQMRRHNPGLHQ
jgi:transcriptional regulator of heat shock response